LEGYLRQQPSVVSLRTIIRRAAHIA
jgi:hypothetical protein